MKRLLTLSLLLSAVLLSGCGGKGDGFGYDGQYHNTYSRGGGTIVFGVSGDSVSVVVNDTTGIRSGTGVRDGSNFSIPCTNGAGTVTVDGAFSGSGSSRSVSGSASGLFSFNYTTIFAHSPNVGVFDPYTYNATLAGSQTGTMVLNTNASGQITGTVTVGANPAAAVSGTVNSVGTANFTATVGSVVYTFFGVFRVMPGNLIVLEGTWTAGANAGTWSGGNSA